MMSSYLQNGQHRQRRRAVFGTPALTSGTPDSSDDEEEGGKEEGQDPAELAARQQSGSSAESSGQDDSETESADSEGEANMYCTIICAAQQ